MEKFDVFIQILSKSGNKYGFDKVLTISHLLNIAKLASKIVDDREIQIQQDLDEALMQCYANECGDR